MMLFGFVFFVCASLNTYLDVHAFPLLVPYGRKGTMLMTSNNIDNSDIGLLLRTPEMSPIVINGKTKDYSKVSDKNFFGRRSAIRALSTIAITATVLPELYLHSSALAWASTTVTTKKCSDIETCREIGDEKLMEQLAANPVTSLPSGVKYKVLQPPTVTDASTGRGAAVTEGSTVDLIYSVTGSGRYMYSQGFGYEDVSFDGKMQKDLGLDSLRIVVGKRDVPLGVEQALIGMKRGERRRVVVPPSVGFDTSNWKPEPTSRRGKAALAAYKQLVEGRGTTQPPFPAPTIWDVEVLSTRK